MVKVDPRVELMSIIFRLAGYPDYNQGRVDAYVQDVEEHFKDFREHPVVQAARKLRKTRGVSYDAAISLALHISPESAIEVAGRARSAGGGRNGRISAAQRPG